MVTIRQVHKEDWAAFSERAHLACFETHKPAEWDRIDYALLIENGDTLMGYATCREWDAQTLYWQFGGAFRGTRSSSMTFKGYQAVAAWSKERYKRVTTLIENDNTVMLKMALKIGFKIIGTRTFKGSVLVELLLEFE